MSQKTVFISYRRDAAGRAVARNLKQELTHRGYDVFLDVDSIDAGKWEAQIFDNVPQRAHFLLVLTPGALDRCGEESDWLRREFLLAHKHRRNIVPVAEESVDISAMRKAADGAMQALFDYQIATPAMPPSITTWQASPPATSPRTMRPPQPRRATPRPPWTSGASSNTPPPA